jgi:hypothetical protein
MTLIGTLSISQHPTLHKLVGSSGAGAPIGPQAPMTMQGEF